MIMNILRTPSIGLLAACLLLPITAFQSESRSADLKLGAPFTKGAILQREMPVPVWGWSRPGAEVTVEFAGQRVTTEASDDGRWSIELAPLEASAEPATMVVSDNAGGSLSLGDILVGEVWIASGQSNMQWPVSQSNVGRLVREILARIEAGEEPRPIIRETKITDVFSSLTPVEWGEAEWSEDWGDFSAVAFAFSYEIARELGVPVGIVNCAFSTTAIQAWTSREGFAGGQDAYTRAIHQRILESDPDAPEHKTAWEGFEEELTAWAAEGDKRAAEGLSIPNRPGVPGIFRGNRDATWMANAKIAPMPPYAIRGGIWNQGYANIGEGIVYRNNLHSLVRGWRALWNNPELPVYFHQFYCPSGFNDGLSFNGTAEMRLGTWLAHLDIPNAAMASQVDVTGGVHYRHKTVPGQRLALHALRNQYGKDVIANGPMFRNYTVSGNRLIVELDHAEGLCVGQSMTERGGYVDPVVIENGTDQVTLFWLADGDMTWHRAKVEIDGETLVLTAPGLAEPRGVAYGTNGVGTLPGIYNKAMLPLTPFVFYDHKLVISDQWDLEHIRIPGIEDPFELVTWPLDHMPRANEVVDPTTYGLGHRYRGLWLLAPQFGDNAVIQHGVPTRLFGMAVPGSVVSARFGDFEEELTMPEDENEWEMTMPAMEPSAEPRQLHVTCTINGKLAHERKLENIVIGDLWFVVTPEFRLPRGPGVPGEGPAPLTAWEGHNPQLRMMVSYASSRVAPMPRRYNLHASGRPDVRHAQRWSPVVGLTRELAERIHARTNIPVGIIAMDPNSTSPIKQWVAYEDLHKVEAWKDDAEQLRSRHEQPPPGLHAELAEDYLALWNQYWREMAENPGF